MTAAVRSNCTALEVYAIFRLAASKLAPPQEQLVAVLGGELCLP
jgi:hypothetical protein